MNIVIKVLFGISILIATSAFFLPADIGKNAFSFLCLALGIAGFARVCIYHPSYNNDYYEWLMSTPWKGGPLPGGSVILSIKDLTLLTVVFLISLLAVSLEWAYKPIVAFFIFYNLALAITLKRNAFFLPIILLPYYFLSGFNIIFFIISLLAVTAFYVYLYLINRKGLFLDSEKIIDIEMPIKGNPLYPNSEFGERSLLEKVLLIVTIVSYSIGLSKLCLDINLNSPSFLIMMAAIIFALMKLSFAFQFGSCSGFIYRIKHFILWDYKFDKIFINPILLILCGLLLSKISVWLSIPLIVALPISTLTLSLIGFFFGPNPTEWALTGKLQLYEPRDLPKPKYNTEGLFKK